MDDRTKRIIELYKKGFGIVKVAQIIGCRTSEVSSIIRKAGIARDTRSNSLGSIKEKELCALYESGIKVPKIVQQTGISEWVVRKVLSKHGVDTSPERTVKLQEDRDRIVSMYQAKRTGGEIARELKIPLAAVYRELRRAGIAGQNWTGPKILFTRYIAPDGRLTRFRSSWETIFARYLDKNEIEWAYESHTWILSDGSSYTPDFWIPSWGLHVEIKGYMTEGAAKKLKMFRDEYPCVNLLLIDRDVFRLYGIQLPEYGSDESYRLTDDAEMTNPILS